MMVQASGADSIFPEYKYDVVIGKLLLDSLWQQPR
jgi:hypothetical protein